MPVRIHLANGLPDAIGPGRKVRIGEDGLAPGRLHGFGYFSLCRGNDNPADLRLHGAAPDLNNHRRPTNVGKRFAGEARGRHAGGNHHDRMPGRIPCRISGRIGHLFSPLWTVPASPDHGAADRRNRNMRFLWLR